MALCRQIMTAPLFFQLMVDLEQYGNWIPEAWSIISTFSLIVILQKLKTELKNF